MSHLVDVMLALPPSVVLLVAFLLPAAEASLFVGVLVPGETAVVVAGVLAHEGVLPLWAVMVAATTGAILGDQIGFQVGRRYGPALLSRLPAWLRRRERPERILDLVRRRGPVAVLLGRWTAALRAFVPGIAGMSGMRLRTFTIANVIGGAIWAVVVALLGYLAGAGYRQLEHRFNVGSGVVFAAVLLVAVIVALVRRIRRPKPPVTSATKPPS